MIEAGNLLGDQAGVAQRQQVDVGAEGEPAADHRGLRQLQQRVEDRDGKRDVIADPQRIVTAAIDEPNQLDHLVDRRPSWRGGRLGAAMDRLDADPSRFCRAAGPCSAFR
jgi:hypothetical protein